MNANVRTLVMMIFVTALFSMLWVICAHAEGDILLRRYDGTYERVTPEGTSPYSVRPDGVNSGYTGVYDRKGDRVGTIKTDNGDNRLYDRKGDPVRSRR